MASDALEKSLLIWVTLAIARFLDTRPTTFEPSDYTQDADNNANDDVIERAEEWNECEHISK